MIILSHKSSSLYQWYYYLLTSMVFNQHKTIFTLNTRMRKSRGKIVLCKGLLLCRGSNWFEISCLSPKFYGLGNWQEWEVTVNSCGMWALKHFTITGVLELVTRHNYCMVVLSSRVMGHIRVWVMRFSQPATTRNMQKGIKDVWKLQKATGYRI